MNRKLLSETLLMVKYGLAGVANTLVTLLAFFLLRWLGVQVDLANFISYAAGIANSFVLNKRFVFRDRRAGWVRQGLVFLLGTGLCWLCQLGIFHLLTPAVGEQWAFLLAMCAYTLLNFIYNRLITFKTNTK